MKKRRASQEQSTELPSEEKYTGPSVYSAHSDELNFLKEVPSGMCVMQYTPAANLCAVAVLYVQYIASFSSEYKISGSFAHYTNLEQWRRY